jgi:glycosyltransferase involved in cell wall biosynthesis
MRPVRVLHVMRDLFAKGGTPRKCLCLARESDPREVRHDFLLFNDTEDSLAAAVEALGSTVLRSRRTGQWDVRLVSDVVRAVDLLESDVVSTHFARADIYGCLGGTLARRPVVKNIHGIVWNESASIKLAQVLDSSLARWRFAVVCNSQATLDAARNRGPMVNPIVVHNGVDSLSGLVEPSDRLRLRGELGIPVGAFVFGHIGGLIPIREQNLLVEAAASLAMRGDRAHCVIVGDGPSRGALESLAHTLGITARVHLVSYRDDVAAVLSVMDAYVNMCGAEGFGIAVVEAMGLGIPVILADAGAHPELIDDGISGLLVPAGALAPLVRALERLSGDSNERARMGAAGRLVAHTRFGMTRYADLLNAVYVAAATSGRDAV